MITGIVLGVPIGVGTALLMRGVDRFWIVGLTAACLAFASATICQFIGLP